MFPRLDARTAFQSVQAGVTVSQQNDERIQNGITRRDLAVATLRQILLLLLLLLNIPDTCILWAYTSMNDEHVAVRICHVTLFSHSIG